MKRKTRIKKGIRGRMILIATALGAFFWILESTLDVFVFQESNLINEVFTSDSHELWTRSLSLCFLIIFSIYAQFIITRRKRAEKVQSMLFRISQAASGSSNLGELLEVVHQQLGTLIDSTNFYVALYNPENDSYSFPYCVDQYDKFQDYTPRQLRKSLSDYVRRTGAPLLADEDIHQQLIQQGEVELVGTPSLIWLGAPLETADGVIGLVVVQSYTDSSCYSTTDLELMTFVSENIASAIERKRGEEALRESEERYRDLFENANDLIQSVDSSGRFEYVNKKWKEVIGYSDEEIKKLNLTDILRKDQVPHCMELFRKVVGGETLDNVEAVFVTKEGREIFVSGAINSRMKDGKFVATRGIFRDITERKRAEEALRESEERFRAISSTANDAIIMMEHEGKISYWNDAAEKIFGYSKKEAIGKDLHDLIVPQRFREAVAKGFEEFERTGQGAAVGKTLELAGLRSDNTEFPVELSLSAVKIKGRWNAIGMVRDITERRRAEEKLLESERKFRTLVEQLPAITYTAALDESSTTLYISPQIEKILGLSPAEYKANPDFWVKHLYPDDRERVLNELSRSHQSGQPFNSEYRMVTQDGRLVWFRDDAAMVRDDKGNPLYLQGVMFDITERKQAEEELNKRTHDLGERLKELNCLYSISRLASRQSDSLEEILQGTVDLIPSAWQYPEITCASAILEDQTFRTSNFKKTEWGQSCDIVVSGERIGTLEVCYLEEKPARDEGPFLKEERSLIDAIAERLGKITERRRAEEALRESENKYRVLVETAHEGIAISDPDENFTFVNQAFVDLLGYQKEELLGLNLSQIVDKKEFAKFRKETEKRKRGEPSRYEAKLYTKAGKPKYFSVSGTPLFDDNGTFMGTLGLLMDITERKKAEEKIRHFQKAVESASDAIGMSTPEGKHYYQNEAFTKLFGFTVEEVRGSEGPPTVYADKEVGAEVFRTIMRGEEWKGEVEMPTRSGRKLFIDLRAYAIKDEKGKVVGLVGVHTDITERKRAEEALKEAKERAESATRAKSEFLANMSHEIRTPMNAIIGMTGIALETDLTDEQQEYLSIVKESSYALLGLIDDILDLSKIEAGRIELDSIDFDLRAMVEGVADTLAPRASPKGLELACLIHPEVPTFLRGDPGRLRQVLMNLGGNAIKFTEKGEVVIGVELEKETEAGATLLFSITDTGIGVPKDKQTKIFESFSQADGSTTRKHGGTGLGLSISRRLVELMGGKIDVESQPGKGSRFWFTVTLEEQRELKYTPPTLPLDIRGMRVLVVDDNKTNRTILVKMLESFGCSAEAVENGDKAIKILKRTAHKEKHFGLVLLDMQMPEMNGEETLRIFKDDPEIKDVVVVMLTSVGVRGDASRLETLGCAAYLLKPIKQSQLFDTIITVLSRQKAEAKEKSIPIVTRHTIAEERRRKIRVLLAEDNPMNQKLAIVLLKKAGYSVDAVEDGRMAIEALKRTAYDLILMDVQMPEMNGLEATRKIRETEGDRRHTPIVAMTAHAMKGDKERCLQAGMDDYISKPIEPQVMIDTIEKWTKPYRRRTALPRQGTSPKGDRSKGLPIDLETALSRFDGDREFLEEVLHEFLDSAPRQLQTLDEAAKKGNAAALQKEAHRLKGTAADLSAKPLADLAFRLESSGRSGDLSGAPETIAELKAELKKLEQCLAKSLAEKVTAKG